MMEGHWPAVARGDEEAPLAMREWAIKLEAKPKYVGAIIPLHGFSSTSLKWRRMKALSSLAIAVVALVVATTSFAADLVTSKSMTGKLLVARGEAAIATRMEYCLRNMPELTELLAMAHVTYSQAAIEAASILEGRFPASESAIQGAGIETSGAKAAEFDLRQARSEGFERLCPNLIVHMHNATGESLAKMYGDSLYSLQKQFAPAP
jgi:hypothetical protein